MAAHALSGLRVGVVCIAGWRLTPYPAYGWVRFALPDGGSRLIRPTGGGGLYCRMAARALSGLWVGAVCIAGWRLAPNPAYGWGRFALPDGGSRLIRPTGGCGLHCRMAAHALSVLRVGAVCIAGWRLAPYPAYGWVRFVLPDGGSRLIRPTSGGGLHCRMAARALSGLRVGAVCIAGWRLTPYPAYEWGAVCIAGWRLTPYPAYGWVQRRFCRPDKRSAIRHVFSITR